MPFRGIIRGKFWLSADNPRKVKLCARISPRIREKINYYLTFIRGLLGVLMKKNETKKSHATVPLRDRSTRFSTSFFFHVSTFYGPLSRTPSFFQIWFWIQGYSTSQVVPWCPIPLICVASDPTEIFSEWLSDPTGIHSQGVWPPGNLFRTRGLIPCRHLFRGVEICSEENGNLLACSWPSIIRF